MDLNEQLFLALNASANPSPAVSGTADAAAHWLVYALVALLPVLWVWGQRERRPALLATAFGVCLALALNQCVGLLWYEPRPFMIGLGHTLVSHPPENSFPSDHATLSWSLGLGLILTGASRAWGLVACLAGVVVAWARIYLGLHFPIDMAASFGVALAASALARTAVPWTRRRVQPLVDPAYEWVLRRGRLPPVLFPRGSGE